MKIIVCGLPHSPNLGDGIISECLVWGLRATHPELQVEILDIAGRRDNRVRESRLRGVLLAAIGSLPKPATHAAALVLLQRIMDGVAENVWRPALSSADLVLVGGGQLLADHALNFPIKLGTLARLCEQLDKPMLLYAVGCAREFSKTGRRLLAQLVESKRMRFVAVRDQLSRTNLLRNFSPKVPVHIVRDPAFLGASVYRELGDSSIVGVGLGVTDPRVLAAHGGKGSAEVGVREFYLELARTAARKARHPVFFTNGAFEDQRYLDRIASSGYGRVERPQRPRELVKAIARFDAVAAHRLHACIIALALGKPVLGLAWDPKMQAFFDSIGRPDALLSPAAGATTVFRRLEEASPLASRHTLADETLNQIGESLRALAVGRDYGAVSNALSI